MKIDEQPDGTFAVISPEGIVLQVLQSNAEAWRWADRHHDDAIRDHGRHDHISHSIRAW